MLSGIGAAEIPKVAHWTGVCVCVCVCVSLSLSRQTFIICCVLFLQFIAASVGSIIVMF
jgi:hypothetical protein